jgi:hypothetical protein
MKKRIAIIIFVCFLIATTCCNKKIPTVNGEFSNTFGSLPSESDKNHIVLIEYGSQTTCSDCPTATNQLYDIYASSEYDCYYVSLVADENEAANNRLQTLAITTYPAVAFDGGYKYVLGERNNAEAYIDALVDSCFRDTHPVDINLEVKWTSSPCFPFIKIYADIINKGTSKYQGKLMISIIEINSRWKDYSGRPYSYALLDYVCDETITIHPSPLGIYSAKYTWFPNTTHCGTAHDPNLLVMVSLFSESNGFADKTVVSRLIDGSPPAKPNKPNGIASGKNGEEYTYTSYTTDPDGDKIKLGWDWNGDYIPDEWTDYYKSGEEITVAHTWENKGNYNIRVKAADEKGMEGFWSDPLPVIMPLKYQTLLEKIMVRVLQLFGITIL